MQADHGDDDEGQQIVQRVKAVQGRIADRKPAPQKGHDAVPDQRDRRKQIGDHGRRPVAHLAPGQHIAHERGPHHQQQDDDAEHPHQFPRPLVGAVIEPPEDVDIDDGEKHRRAIGVRVADQPAVIDVAHDALDQIEGEFRARRVLHRQKNAGADHHDQHEPGQRPEIPPIAEVARGRIFVELVLHRCHERQPVVDPAEDPARGAGSRVGHGGLLADLDDGAGEPIGRCDETGRRSLDSMPAAIIDRPVAPTRPAAAGEIAPGAAAIGVGDVLLRQIGHSIPRHRAPAPGPARQAKLYC